MQTMQTGQSMQTEALKNPTIVGFAWLARFALRYFTIGTVFDWLFKQFPKE